MSIGEQVKELREYANFISGIFTEDIDVLKSVFSEAADTIEVLSAKLAEWTLGGAINKVIGGHLLDSSPLYGDLFRR